MSLSSSTRISSSTPPPSSHEMAATPNNWHTEPHLAAFSAPQSSILLEPASAQSPSRSDSEPLTESESISSANAGALADVDPQIVEALKSKDRIYVLKLGEQMESLINDRRPRIDLTPNTSYQRLLVHRCSAYYKLAPETDPNTKVISVLPTLESRIPARRIAELVPAQSPTQPTIKIMRRSILDRQRSKPHSQAGSVTCEDAELSDVEPSEAGSLGGRSNATGSSKKLKTIAEREAAYNEARSRIFMDFEEKEKGKEKDLSASSSTVSLTSGSVTSAGGTSSTGDLDDSVSSPTTESEWSGPVVRDKKDSRWSNGSSSRSLRSNAPTFNGSNSSRGSRAPSPSSFKYPTLYEPSPAASPYDLSQPPVQAPGYGNPYLYAYPQPVPPPNYIPPYPYYAPYPYPQPQTPMHNADPATPSNQADVYASQQHPLHQGVYVPYAWPPTQQHQAPAHRPAPHQSHSTPSPPIAPPASQYSTFTPPAPAYGPYPMPAYYTSPPPMHHMQSSPSPAPNHAHYSPEYNGGNEAYSTNRPYPGVIGQQSPTMGPKPRSAPPARSAWSYGPGVSMGGFGMNGGGGRSGGGGEVVGPRLSSTVRRHPGNSGASPGSRTLAGDEASSSASSSTSSSSRRTFTSTTSSQHPLPARPDWAVGLKPQPTLHATNRHHDLSTNSRNMSPARNNGQRGQQAPLPLQLTDFPPLTSINPASEKRMPVAGVWTNSSSTRSLLANNTSGAAFVNHSNSHPASLAHKPEESEALPEPPPAKGGIEHLSPKGAWKSSPALHNRNPAQHDRADKDKERLRGDVIADAILVDKVAILSLEEKDGGSAVNAAKGVTAVALAT
ncbi:hypothetical protein BU15DRAFT_45653 [Melanogaster broomeanus]|nr:hypothetical protein BU15DRAFT_45653 [Melanogaster broomeanus]